MTNYMEATGEKICFNPRHVTCIIKEEEDRIIVYLSDGNAWGIHDNYERVRDTLLPGVK